MAKRQRSLGWSAMLASLALGMPWFTVQNLLWSDQPQHNRKDRSGKPTELSKEDVDKLVNGRDNATPQSIAATPEAIAATPKSINATPRG